MICRYRLGDARSIGWLDDEGVRPLPGVDSVEQGLRLALAGEMPAGLGAADAGSAGDDPQGGDVAAASGSVHGRDEVELEPPIDAHEIWAAGVTYERSREARMEEAEDSGGSWLYDKVYEAERPELFFKATPNRVAAPDAFVRARADSSWSVPEPELSLWLDADLNLLGLGLGDDVSARDIEGDNALYLPQAKLYAQACALGPGVLPCDDFSRVTGREIEMRILRGEQEVFSGSVSTSRLHRRAEDLVDWLGRENVFPNGAVLMTGTGVVPPDDFTLAAGDRIEISSPGLGTLVNTVRIG